MAIRIHQAAWNPRRNPQGSPKPTEPPEDRRWGWSCSSAEDVTYFVPLYHPLKLVDEVSKCPSNLYIHHPTNRAIDNDLLIYDQSDSCGVSCNFQPFATRQVQGDKTPYISTYKFNDCDSQWPLGKCRLDPAPRRASNKRISWVSSFKWIKIWWPEC